MTVREDAELIMKAALDSVLPDRAVKETLRLLKMPKGKVILIAIGKAGWQMASAAQEVLGDRVTDGVCITKYQHVKGDIPHICCYEAGHPIPDANSFEATRNAETLVSNLSKEDMVVFLISGGGSALFEDSLISEEELQDLTKQLLACGADIKEINTIRKRLSNVKGGKFAKLCEPASVISIVLSDVVGDSLDMIASGPAYPDSTTCEDALNIVSKYGLKVSDSAMLLLKQETPKELWNVETYITGSVRQLCESAMRKSEELGYEAVFLTASMECLAKEAGSILASIARDHDKSKKSLAYICGGETRVLVTGEGLGGRNQEIVLSAADGIAGMKDTVIFSLGSDGTDGPTDAAGGIVDGETAEKLKIAGIKISHILQENDSYHALKKAEGLIWTGPTGTNVNDVTVLLIKR